MNSLEKSKGMMRLALAALAIALVSGLGSAQEPVGAKGEFNLPFSARWGGMTLTPGQYSFTLTRSIGGVPIITVQRGTSSLGMVLGYVIANRRSSGRSYLDGVRVGAAYSIALLQLSDPGIEIRFFTPKHPLLEASQTTHLARKVPVVVASR